jgi:hypothetical protein
MSIDQNRKENKTTHLLLLNDLGKGAVYPVGIEVDAQLANDKAPACIQKSPVRAKQLEEVDHERLEVAFV